MSTINRVAGAAATCLFFTAGAASAHQPGLDGGLYANYEIPKNGTYVSFVVCGTLAQGHGCYGATDLTDFQSACAVVEGTPTENGNVVTRSIYILDRRAVKNDPMKLFVYQRTDTITNTFDTVSVTLTNQVSLNIPGSPKAKCSLAGNDNYLYAGTNKHTTVLSIAKGTFATSIVSYDNPPVHLKSITADANGFVTIFLDNDSYETYADSGALIGSGGANAQHQLANTLDAITPN